MLQGGPSDCHGKGCVQVGGQDGTQVQHLQFNWQVRCVNRLTVCQAQCSPGAKTPVESRFGNGWVPGCTISGLAKWEMGDVITNNG